MRTAVSFLLRLVISAVALWVAAAVLSGVAINTDSTAKKIVVRAQSVARTGNRTRRLL